jgi:hypothetical protein
MELVSFKVGQSGFGFIFLRMPVDQFALPAGKKALGHAVVVGIAQAAHGWTHSHLLTTPAKLDSGVLALPPFVGDDAPGRAPRAHGNRNFRRTFPKAIAAAQQSLPVNG